MATQITASLQAQVVSAEALQQIFSICDSVADDLRNGAQIRPVPVSSVFPQGGQVVEVLRGRLEAIANVRFEIFADTAVGTVLYPVTESMSVGPSASSADPDVGASATTAVAHPKKDKTPRPKNAFMIYRLDFHATVAADNPGMHNNDISKIIGAKWRSEAPHIVEEYKRRAAEEKRQHAIAHPGYRYQPRKPSERKKRMTQSKLAKLAANSGSSFAPMDTTLHVQDHNDVDAQTFDLLNGEQLGVGIDTSSFDEAAFMSLPATGANLDFSVPMTNDWSADASFEQQGQDTAMMVQQDLNNLSAAQFLPSSFTPTVDPAALHEAFYEQHIHQQLDGDFGIDNLVHDY